jgi:hypothetical protein
MPTQLSSSVDFAIGVFIVATLTVFLLTIVAVSRWVFGSFVNSTVSAYSETYARDLEEIAQQASPVPVTLIYTELRKAGSLVNQFKLNGNNATYKDLEPLFGSKAYLTVIHDMKRDYYTVEVNTEHG